MCTCTCIRAAHVCFVTLFVLSHGYGYTIHLKKKQGKTHNWEAGQAVDIACSDLLWYELPLSSHKDFDVKALRLSSSNGWTASSRLITHPTLDPQHCVRMATAHGHRANLGRRPSRRVWERPRRVSSVGTSNCIIKNHVRSN